MSVQRTIEYYVVEEDELENIILPDNIEYVLEKFERKVYRDIMRKKMKSSKCSIKRQ